MSVVEPQSATLTNVSTSASSVALVAAEVNPKGWVIWNDSAVTPLRAPGSPLPPRP